MPRRLHRARFVHGNMPRRRSNHALMRPQRRGDDRRIRLRPSHKEVDLRRAALAKLQNARTRAFAVRILSVAYGLLKFVSTSRSRIFGCAPSV